MAGDVTVRAARTRGESVLSVSGLDVHQNYVVTAAEQEGRTPAEVIEDYGAARIRSAFALVVPARVRDLFDRLLAEGLPDIPLAYPTDWGIPGPGGTRIDVWVEMALGYLYAVPRRLGTQSTMPSRLVSTPRLITANPPRSSGASPSQPNSATR